MKRILGAVGGAIALLVLVLFQGYGAFAAPPAPTEWVTDTANFLSGATRQTLDERLATFEHTTGHQVLVWVGKTTGGTPIEAWAADTFRTWRVGRKGLDDGLVLFLLADDHTARIEVGYGLEEQMPDATASRILSEEILPRLKAGDRDGAVSAGVDRILVTLGGEGISPGDTRSESPPPRPLSPLQQVLIGLLVIAGILLVIRYPRLAVYLFYLISSGARGNGGNGGGGSGGGFRGGGGRSGGGGASGKW